MEIEKCKIKAEWARALRSLGGEYLQRQRRLMEPEMASELPAKVEILSLFTGQLALLRYDWNGVGMAPI